MESRFLRAGISLGLLALFLSPAAGITEKAVPVSEADTLRASLATAETLYVYEGLPHQSSEADLLRQEQARNDVTKIGDFPFYVPKFQAAKGRSASLKKLLTAPGRHREWGGPEALRRIPSRLRGHLERRRHRTRHPSLLRLPRGPLRLGRATPPLRSRPGRAGCLEEGAGPLREEASLEKLSLRLRSS